MSEHKIDYDLPYSPDVAERQTSDEGFSRGWGEHFQPNEAYWVDCHVHMRDKSTDVMARAVGEYFERLDAWRLRRVIALDARSFTVDAFAETGKKDDRFCWCAWPRYHEPDADFVDRAFQAGACGLKLHNAHILTEGGDYKVWLGKDWQRVFERVAAQRKCILWHVTQRLTDSPYTGGNRDSYWREARQSGLTCTNADLLEVFLQVVKRYPDIPFIGAHQLHVGFDKLDELFERHPNLLTDTSCGFFVRWGDHMYDADRRRARQFFLRHSGRILFGTDCGIGVEATQEYVFQSFLGHVRYLRQLHLPHDVLQAVSHCNTERTFGLPELQVKRKGNVRP